MNGRLERPEQIRALLQDACRALDHSGDHAIAAVVSHAVALMQAAYPEGDDQPEQPDEPPER